MTITVANNQIVIIATIAQLRDLRDSNEKIFGTPNAGDTVITEAYQASRPSWANDRVVADLQDFLEVLGWDDLGKSDSDDESDSVTVRMPTAIRTLAEVRGA